MSIDNDADIQWDVDYGLHSGVPPCCIRFYVTEWTYGPTTRKTNIDGWGYVPCDDCIKSGRKASLVDCNIDCGGLCRYRLWTAGIAFKMRAYAHRLLEGYK